MRLIEILIQKCYVCILGVGAFWGGTKSCTTRELRMGGRRGRTDKPSKIVFGRPCPKCMTLYQNHLFQSACSASRRSRSFFGGSQELPQRGDSNECQWSPRQHPKMSVLEELSTMNVFASKSLQKSGVFSRKE